MQLRSTSYMKALTTPFGRDYRFNRLTPEESGGFYGIPSSAVSPEGAKLLPDLAPFVLNDRVLMDVGFYHRLVSSDSSQNSELAKFYVAANEAGRLQLVDYEYVLSNKRQVLDRMLEIDLEHIEAWLPRIQESLEIWREIFDASKVFQRELILESVWSSFGHARAHFSTHVRNYPVFLRCYLFNQELGLFGQYSHRQSELVADLLKSLKYKTYRRTRAQKALLSQFVASRLAYINANIVLGQHFNASLFDWADSAPMYEWKFDQVAEKHPHTSNQDNKFSCLAELMFPGCVVGDYDEFFSALDNTRVVELRALISCAARGEVLFDQEFATSVWKEQFAWSEERRRFSKRISWWVLPASLISVLGSVVEKVGGALDEKIHQSPHPWVFQLTDLVVPKDK